MVGVDVKVGGIDRVGFRGIPKIEHEIQNNKENFTDNWYPTADR